ncbi:MAG: protein kinase domain-containing protein [Anaerolineae bacterium]
MQDFIGTRFGQYEILAPIGEGGMGMVYRARDTLLNREVAVKVLPPELARDREFVTRFRREAETAASLDHPHIVAIYNIGEQDGVHYLAMRLLEGQPLNHILKHSGALPLERALHITEQLARALDYAHARGVIHRDVKPANIMVGEDEHVTLMDFGIAKAVMGSKLTRTGTMIGTPEYMAPEQFTGETVDLRADIYAVGVVLYEMLTGRVPFTGETPVSISHGHVYQQPAPPRQLNAQIPPAVEHVLLRGLAKRPEERYPNAGALAEALHAAVRGGAAPVSAPARQPLKIVTPDGYEYALAPGTLHLGRAEENDVVIYDAQISRRHAEIHSDTQSSAVVDLDSANGTFVNGQRLVPHHPHILQAGMSVRLGTKVTLQVRAGMPVKRKTMPFEQPGGKPPHPPDKTTAQAPVSPPGKKNQLLRSVGGLGCVLGAIGIGVIAIVIVGLILWNHLREPATPTLDATTAMASPELVVVTATPDPQATQSTSPVTVIVTATPLPVTSTPKPTPVTKTTSPTPVPPAPAVDRIVYACGTVGKSNICTIDLEGNTRTLISSSSDDAEPDWHPATQKLVFQSDREGNYDIFVSDAEGRNVENLTQTRNQDERLPDWSPDGKSILYEVGDGADNGEIRVLNIAENRTVKLATGRAPVWSPDGNYIAYMQKQSNGYWQLFIHDVRDNTMWSLPHSGEHCRFPAWSPDGEWLAYNTYIFGSVPRGQTYDIWRVRVDGGSRPQRLTTTGDSGRPAWSANGKHIVYNYGDYLYLLDVDKKTSTRLNHTDNGWAPDWSW